jgi:hypothetical protein
MAATKKKRIAWFLRAPGCGLAVVAAPNYEQATVKAAELWGVPWGKIVSQIEVERTAEQKPNVCVECGGGLQLLPRRAVRAVQEPQKTRA